MLSIPWFSVGELELTISFDFGSLNVLMLFLVAFISAMVQIYSKAYMGNDRHRKAYYWKLNLFTFSMLALVVSSNLIQIYVFWELIGLGSFLLIGHYNREKAKKAANKAFIMTRIGDVALLIGILLLFSETGSFELQEIFRYVQSGVISEGTLTTITFCLFIGAVGKSAQFPLHTWLPDAMEGPTPVSALLHAATMVAAGVFLIAHLYPIFLASSTVLLCMSIIGGLTAFFSATIAIVEKDVKRVLAYSTVSQLGFMFLSLGSFGYVGAIFHLMTHAFFKALLFLSVGSLIKQSGTQSIEQLRGFGKTMPEIHISFFIGTLAISGIPFLSGYFSKEEMLSSIFIHAPRFLFWLALVTSILTALYMFRLYFLLFFERNKTEQATRFVVSKWMSIPIGFLAFGSLFIGFTNTHLFGTYLGDWLTEDLSFPIEFVDANGFVSVVSIVASTTGFFIAYLLYKRNWITKLQVASMSRLYKIVEGGYGFDLLYQQLFVKGMMWFVKWMGYFERKLDRCFSVIPKMIFTLANIEANLRWKNPQIYGFVAVVGLLLLITLSIWSIGVRAF